MNEHLYRSRDDRMIAGVAGGLAEIWDADPSLIRIVWALLVVLTGGIALLVYIVMAIVVPEGGRRSVPGRAAAAPPPPRRRAGSGPAGRPRRSWRPRRPPRCRHRRSPRSPPMPPPDRMGRSVDRARDRRARARQAARAARRAARRERGGDRTAGIVIGAILILIGGVFFLREWLPAFDFDWFWPLILVGLGVVLLVVGFTRDSGSGGTAA